MHRITSNISNWRRRSLSRMQKNFRRLSRGIKYGDKKSQILYRIDNGNLKPSKNLAIAPLPGFSRGIRNSSWSISLFESALAVSKSVPRWQEAGLDC